MAIAFKRGQALTKDDLMIAVRDTYGNLVDPAVITYSIFDYTTGMEVLIGAPNQVPSSTGVGMFFAATVIPLDANIGEWVVRWNMRQQITDPIVQVVQRFQVVGEQVVTDITSNSSEKLMIRRLRILLRDNNPDRNYRFRPPSTEKFIQSQTEVFGYIWEDEELFEYILMSVDTFNSAPPVTGIVATDIPDRWRTVVLMGAAAHACRAVALNWIADEFSVDGEETVWVRDNTVDKLYKISLKDLHAAASSEYMDYITTQVREFQKEDGIVDAYTATYTVGLQNDPIFRAIRRGTLEIKSVEPSTGAVRWSPVSAVLKHAVSAKRIFEVSLSGGPSVSCTEDHSLFRYVDATETKPCSVVATRVSDLKVGDWAAVVPEGSSVVEAAMVTAVVQEPFTLYMYDVSVPGDENFVLSSGILAHNSYSISGVSLDIDKSSKYQGMKENFESEHEKMLEQAKNSIKIVKGLQQPRYGIGISSALGPFSRVGVQSRRNYVSGGAGWS